MLGQQDKAQFIGAALEAWNDRPAGRLQPQKVGPERLFGIDVLERKRLGSQQERPPPFRSRGSERACLNDMGDGASGLTHEIVLTEPEQPAP